MNLIRLKSLLHRAIFGDGKPAPVTRTPRSRWARLCVEQLEDRTTPSSVSLVQNINPAAGSSFPVSLTNVNGTLFFSADDGANGYELWKSDGTAAGTVLVKDIRPGADSSYPRSLTNVNGTLFFEADDGANGRELWKAAEFSDDFNRVDSTTLGAPWTEVAGDFAVVDQQLLAIGPATSEAVVNNVSLAHVRVQAEVSLLLTGTSRVDLIARRINSTNMYLGSLIGNNGAFTAVISRMVNGTTVNLSSAVVVPTFGDGVLRFEVAGCLLKLYFNDVLVGSVFDAAITSAGGAGVNGTAFAAVDNFFVSPIDPEFPFGDSFTRNLDSTSLGSQWREQAGDLVVLNNKLLAKGTGANLGIYTWAALQHVRVQAQVKVQSFGSSAAGLIARYGGAGDANYYQGVLQGEGGVFTARIFRNVNGVRTQLASAAVNVGAGLLRFEVVGNSLKLFLNDTLAVQATDTMLSSPGYVGVGGAPRTTYDNFNAERMDPTLFSDGFNRGNAANLGAQWTNLSGAVGIVSNQAKAANVGTNLAVRHGIVFKDVKLEAAVTVLNTGFSEAGLVARAVNATNYYYAALEGNNGSFSVAIYKVVNNVKTRIGAAASVGAATGKLRFEAVGNSLKLFFNDVVQVNVLDNTYLAAGLAGLRVTPFQIFDNFTMA